MTEKEMETLLGRFALPEKFRTIFLQRRRMALQVAHRLSSSPLPCAERYFFPPGSPARRFSSLCHGKDRRRRGQEGHFPVLHRAQADQGFAHREGLEEDGIYSRPHLHGNSAGPPAGEAGGKNLQPAGRDGFCAEEIQPRSGRGERRTAAMPGKGERGLAGEGPSAKMPRFQDGCGFGRTSDPPECLCKFRRREKELFHVQAESTERNAAHRQTSPGKPGGGAGQLEATAGRV